MRCPACSVLNSHVVDSRTIQSGRTIRRRRECLECAKRFTTYEAIEEEELMVVKTDPGGATRKWNKKCTMCLKTDQIFFKGPDIFF